MFCCVTSWMPLQGFENIYLVWYGIKFWKVPHLCLAKNLIETLYVLVVTCISEEGI